MALTRSAGEESVQRRRDAFTLVEAVVLIAILGILGAVAAPRFLSMRELETARARRQALADLRHAQRQAAGSGCPVEVDFEPTGYRLRQRSDCRTGDFDRELVDPITQQQPFAVVLPENVALASDVDPIVFDTLGRLTTAEGVTTDLQVSIGTLVLEGVGETGLVRVP
jgi:type II secretory pathway pseudopilin PulG